MMNKNEMEALRLLGVYTAFRFDPWALAGNAKAGCRAHIMSELNGVRTPQNKSGVNAMIEAFVKLSGVNGTCAADTKDKLIQWCKERMPE